MSSENTVAQPTQQLPLLLGPFEVYHVIVNGRRIPKLTGRRDPDGKIWLTVDGRITAFFSDEENASQAARLAANAMAVGAGYPCLEADTKDHPFAS